MPPLSPHRREISTDAFVDDWGIEWRRSPGSLYYEVARNPLRDATVDDLRAYTWPKLDDPSRFMGIADQAKTIRDGAKCGVVAPSGVALFEQVLLLRGMDAFLMDMAVDREFAEELISVVAHLFLGSLEALIREAGELIDVVTMADGMGYPTRADDLTRDVSRPPQAVAR